MSVEQRTILASPLARAATKIDQGELTEVAGLAVPYDTPTPIGYFTETIRRGAFTKSIRNARNGIPLLLLHDSKSVDSILGRAMPGDFTDARDGLHVRFTLNSSRAAQDAAQLAHDGGLGYLSIGFVPVATTETVDAAGDMFVEVTEARLLEVSLVSTPAYAGATVEQVRAAIAADHPDPGEIAIAALLLAVGDPDAATELYCTCIDPDLPPRQRHAASTALIRWAAHGPRWARHAIHLEAVDPTSPIEVSTLARLLTAISDTSGTPSQQAASATAIRAHYAGSDYEAAVSATAPADPAAPRRRRHRR